MKRRLHYLIPDTPHVQSLSRELADLAIPRLSKQVLSESRPEINQAEVHTTAESDRADTLEWWLWRVNLAVFFGALFASSGVLVFLPWSYMAVPLLVMAISLVAGAVVQPADAYCPLA